MATVDWLASLVELKLRAVLRLYVTTAPQKHVGAGVRRRTPSAARNHTRRASGPKYISAYENHFKACTPSSGATSWVHTNLFGKVTQQPHSRDGCGEAARDACFHLLQHRVLRLEQTLRLAHLRFEDTDGAYPLAALPFHER